MNWILTGPIVVTVQAVNVDDTASPNRYVCFEVPEEDALFVSAVTQRWLTSFEELAFQAQEKERESWQKKSSS